MEVAALSAYMQTFFGQRFVRRFPAPSKKELVPYLVLTVASVRFHDRQDDCLVEQCRSFRNNILVPRVLPEDFHLFIGVTKMSLHQLPFGYIPYFVPKAHLILQSESQPNAQVKLRAAVETFLEAVSFNLLLATLFSTLG